MKRLHLETIGWHVIARGTRRLELFREEEDYRQYLSILKSALHASGSELWAYTLMSNHYHLVIRADSDQLTGCMRRLNTKYSYYHNVRYDLAGHTFDAPYKCFPQPSKLLLLRCVAYVFMNPVAAGMRKSPEEYRWSCYRDYVGLPGSPLGVNPKSLMATVNDNPKVAWEQFHRAVERESRRKNSHPTGAPSMVQIHQQQFEWLLEHARTEGVAPPDVAPEILAMYWARQYGIASRAMTKALNLEDPAEVSRELYRFGKRLASDPSLKRRIPPP